MMKLLILTIKCHDVGLFYVSYGHLDTDDLLANFSLFFVSSFADVN